MKADAILDIGERYLRTVGYNGFSFREVAAEVGIKSASVHYHFATKEDLAAAVARRYSERFHAALGPPAATRIAVFVDLFRGALNIDGRMCLFCVLGAEFATLPPGVQVVVKAFFDGATEWIASALAEAEDTSAEHQFDRAQVIVATLEGAMIVARCTGDIARFDRIVSEIKRAGVLPA